MKVHSLIKQIKLSHIISFAFISVLFIQSILNSLSLFVTAAAADDGCL